MIFPYFYKYLRNIHVGFWKRHIWNHIQCTFCPLSLFCSYSPYLQSSASSASVQVKTAKISYRFQENRVYRRNRTEI